MKSSFLRGVDCLRGVGAIHRDGACGGPLKRDVLSIRGGDLSGKVL